MPLSALVEKQNCGLSGGGWWSDRNGARKEAIVGFLEGAVVAAGGSGEWEDHRRSDGFATVLYCDAVMGICGVEEEEEHSSLIIIHPACAGPVRLCQESNTGPTGAPSRSTNCRFSYAKKDTSPIAYGNSHSSQCGVTTSCGMIRPGCMTTPSLPSDDPTADRINTTTAHILKGRLTAA